MAPTSTGPDVAAEIEDVGRSQLQTVESLLAQALGHMLKAEDVRQQARRRFAESMRQRIDLARLCRQAQRALPESVDGEPTLPVPAECPVTLDDLLTIKA